MDSAGLSKGGGAPSSRRELHGPRPVPLKVRNDSYKIKKPSAAPPQQQIRRPIIIYTVSPKVIHTTSGNFMSVVQSLTGPSSSSAAAVAPAAMYSSAPLASVAIGAGQAFSPADRMAAIGRAVAQALKTPVKSEKIPSISDDDRYGAVEAAATMTMFATAGILSPVPSALPIIPPSLFTQPPSAAERSQINCWSNELGAGSLVVDRWCKGMDGLFTASPNSNFFLSSGMQCTDGEDN